MLRWIPALFLLVLSTALGGGDVITITSVDARLFYHHTGTLSAPIKEDAALWNTIIGEGSAAEPSTAVLVDVVVAGTPGEYRTTWGIDLVVKSGTTGKVLSKQSSDVGVLSGAGQYHVGFWLKNTGCERLRIQARVKGTNKWTETVVPFACGE